MIVDAHNDLLIELAFFRDEPNPFATRWLRKLEAGGVDLQVCALFAEGEALPEGALRQTLGQIAAFRRAVATNPDRVTAIETRSDLDEAAAAAKIGLMLSIEGVEPLGYDDQLIDVFVDLGVRMVSLTWNRRNPFADGTAEPPGGGLSVLGRRLVERIDSLPVVLDLAHANERTFFDALEVAPESPVMVSHAGCRTLCDTPRNLSDAQLKALAERDGVVGLMAQPLVVHPTEWTIERLLDHVDHVVELVGIRHIGLGSDFSRQLVQSGALRTAGLGAPVTAPGANPAVASLESVVEGFTGPEDFPNLVAGLRERGYRDIDLQAILSQNVLRVLRRALPD